MADEKKKKKSKTDGMTAEDFKLQPETPKPQKNKNQGDKPPRPARATTTRAATASQKHQERISRSASRNRAPQSSTAVSGKPSNSLPRESEEQTARRELANVSRDMDNFAKTMKLGKTKATQDFLQVVQTVVKSFADPSSLDSEMSFQQLLTSYHSTFSSTSSSSSLTTSSSSTPSSTCTTSATLAPLTSSGAGIYAILPTPTFILPNPPPSPSSSLLPSYLTNPSRASALSSSVAPATLSSSVAPATTSSVMSPEHHSSSSVMSPEHRSSSSSAPVVPSTDSLSDFPHLSPPPVSPQASACSPSRVKSPAFHSAPTSPTLLSMTSPGRRSSLGAPAPPSFLTNNRFSSLSDQEDGPEAEADNMDLGAESIDSTEWNLVQSPRKRRASLKSPPQEKKRARTRTSSSSSTISVSSSSSGSSSSSSSSSGSTGNSSSSSSSRSRSPSPVPSGSQVARQKQPAPSGSQVARQKQQKTTRNSPLFVSISDPSLDTAVIHNQLIPLTSKRIRTQKGNLLVYPKSDEARQTLISSSFQGFSCRATLGSQKKTSTMDPAGPPPKQNLFVVVRGVDRKYSDEQLTELFGRTSTRMYSAAIGGTTRSIRSQCNSKEDKDKLLKEGLSFNFSKLTVEDYRQSGPRQCFKCQSFGHLATSCTNPVRCKNCSGDHSHKDCKATSEETQQCPNCQGSHPSTFKGCPAYKTAKEKQVQDQISYAQKAAPRTPAMDGVRLATALSEGIFASLRSTIQELKREDIYTTVANIVSVVYRTRVTASQMLSTFPSFD